ncbi:hypothetical protein [Allokutzneria oryzae]|uniref:Thiopeptide-type bacteriocin biosynthesis domain-containing protein n=1 Tax=Allokutzneria oryzae TaxID=1378989 RepID=A0ABV5ZSH8_9PSEU
MHLFAVVPWQETSSLNETAALIGEVFSPEHTKNHGPYYFVRTRDHRTGAEALQLSIAEVTDQAETRKALVRAAERHGRTVRVDEVPLDSIPSPLWNSGFDGPGFPALSRRLYQRAAPILATFLNRAAQADNPLQSALDAIRLMVAHTRATLLRSPQRSLAGYEFRELLSLRLLSYRSHFEAVYPRTKDPASFEAACARFYAQAGPEIHKFVTSSGDADAIWANDAVIRQWTELVMSASHPLAADFRDGTVVDAGRTLEDLVRERGAPVEPTRFHTPRIPELERLLHHDTDFLSFRLLTSLLYSCLYTLGFSLPERYVYCYVAARANEEVAGRSMLELAADLDDLARRVAAVSAAGAE